MGTSRAEDLNGVSADDRQILHDIMANPVTVAGFSGPWKTEVSWLGGFRTTATIRQHRVDFDEPSDLTGQDSSPTPHEYALSAIGACVLTGFILLATMRGIGIGSARLEVEGNFENILRWAGLSQDGSSGYQSIVIHAYISGSASVDALQDVWDEALLRSPVGNSIQKRVPINSIVQVIELVDSGR